MELDGAEYQLTGRDAELLRRFLELRPQPRAYPQFKLTFDVKGRRVRPGLQVGWPESEAAYEDIAQDVTHRQPRSALPEARMEALQHEQGAP